VNTATEWKTRAAEAARREAVELELPSGAKILARRPTPVQLAVWGRLPLELSAAAAGLAPKTDPSPKEGVELMHFYRDLLLYICVEPRISMEPRGEDEIHPRDIPEQDWKFLYAWAMRLEEDRALKGFRSERSSISASGDSEDVVDPAVESVGDRGPGNSIEF